MSASPLVTNIINSVSSALTSRGTPSMYPPDLEFLIIQVLTELSADPLVDATAQALFSAQIALTATDVQP